MQLKILEALKFKGMLTKAQKKELNNRRRGQQSETELAQWLQQLNPHWIILRNLLVDLGSKVELDFILISDRRVIHLEVKDYQGHLTYNGTNTALNNYLLSHCPFVQRQRAHNLLASFFQNVDAHIVVESWLVFMNEFMTFESVSQLPKQVLMRHEVPRFLNSLPQRVPHRALKKQLLTKQTKLNKAWLPHYSQIPSGVHCLKCTSTQTLISHRSITCRACAFKITKTKYLKRAVDYYAALNWHTPLTAPALNHAFAKRFSRQLILRHLNAHYPVLKTTNQKYFVNPYTQQIDS